MRQVNIQELQFSHYLHGTDDVIREVQLLDVFEPHQGEVTNALDVVPGESQHLELVQVFEGSLSVLYSVGQLVTVQVELLQQSNLLERVLGLDVRDEVVPEVEILKAGKSSQYTPLHYLKLVTLQREKVSYSENISVIATCRLSL